MKHHVYGEPDNSKYPIAILVKSNAFNLTEIENGYISSLEREGIQRHNVIIVELPYEKDNKVTVKFMKEQLCNIMQGLVAVGTDTIYCADANYFKVLTKQKNAGANIGYEVQCKLEGYEDLGFTIVLGINHKSLIHNPANLSKLEMSVKTLIDVHNGTFVGFSESILNHTYYPHSLEQIEEQLTKLHNHPVLTCDIEGYSLKFNEAKIASIAFAWNTTDGTAFLCDHSGCADKAGVRKLLKEFFENYTGKLIFHNASYDTKSLILNLWMNEDLLDYVGMLRGLDVLFNDLEDTKLIAYLATNTTAGNKLGLKDLSHEFCGDYAEDVTDIRKLKVNKLLAYNLTDCCATFYVFQKHTRLMVENKQEAVYRDLFLPSLKTIIHSEMIGMPLNIKAVKKAKKKLEDVTAKATDTIFNSKIIIEFTEELRLKAMLKANALLKTKTHDISHFNDPSTPHYVKFNPNSSLQLQSLMYFFLALPIQEYTEKKQPSTKADHLESLMNHTNDPAKLEIIEAITTFARAEKILNTFISAFEKAIDKGEYQPHHKRVWLHGSFNLGGTKSGRMSSSGPNLQNLPSGKLYGKLIKSCFQAPVGWLFGGADFSSLEDRISALQTKDVNKLKVYTDGYDGHSLRAYSYFPEKLKGIEDTVESINSIAEKYPQIRQDSKAITFLLTYGGTNHGLQKILGFSKEDAIRVESNYHKLYEESDKWVQGELDQASASGYVELAFGLRLKTPLLQQSLRNRPGTLKELQSEERTAGNALGQSFGLLNNRALNAFMEKVYESEHRYNIMPIAQIHDAIYLIWKDDLAVTKFVNDNLIKAMEWQELSTIKHDTVKLAAELCIYYPSWADEIKVPNYCDTNTILSVCTGQTKAA